MPLKTDVGLPGVTIVPPTPATMVQVPVPTVGVFAAKVVEVVPQVPAPVWSAPAAAMDGLSVKVITTSSVDGAQGGFVIVQRRVYTVPAPPEKAEVGLVGVVTVPPTPAMIVQAPVPAEGVLAARVAEVAQRF